MATSPDAVTPGTGRLSGKKVLLGLAVILVLAVIPSIVIPLVSHQQPTLVDYGAIPPFHLTDERGQPFSDAAMRGKVTIVSFLFTRCDTICPVNSMKMAAVQDKTADVGDKIKLVSFSVDPTYDTPERLAAYAKRYHADPERWRFVTGTEAAVEQVVTGGFMTSMQRQGTRPTGAPDIRHGGYFLLIDPNLHIRGRYDTSDVKELDKMTRAARFLARTMH